MTIKEIAQLAGVSISTVSKIMNHKDSSISSETRERVLRIVKEFNYSPYSNTITCNTKTFILGLLIRSTNINRTMNGIIETASELGYTVLVCNSKESFSEESKGITALCRHRVDGVLWEPVGSESLKYAKGFTASGIPFITFNSYETEDSYNLDFEKMAYDLTLAMIKSHHTDISCLLSPGTRTSGFLNGYRRCLFDAGIPFQESMVYSDITDVLIHKITNHSITGVAASHFSAAMHLYGTLHEMHYQIPYDVSLVSLRDDERTAGDYPHISSITIPYYKFGHCLCKKLIKKIEQSKQSVPLLQTESVLDSAATIAVPFTRRMSKIIVVGSINIDNYLKVNQLPTTGKAIITSNASLYPGGKAINQSIGASKLGCRTALIGNSGNDIDSDLIFSSLQEHGVDSAGVKRSTDSATGKAYIFVQPDGNSMISILSGANSMLTPDDVAHNERLFKNSSYCLVQTEIPSDTVISACMMAHKHGAKTILKPSTCSTLDTELLKYVDIIVPNFDEVNELCHGDTLSKQADYFLSHGVQTVIVTLGQDGCYVKTNEFEENFPAANFQSVDNTGACDAFISALAAYLQFGYCLKKAVKIATYAAGFSIMREGVVPSLIDRNTLESYINQKEPLLLIK